MLTPLFLTTCYGLSSSITFNRQFLSFTQKAAKQYGGTRSRPKFNFFNTKSFSSKSDDELQQNQDDQQQNEDNWRVPSNFHIPIHELNLSFARSSGPGGQNVQKVETQVVLKLHLDTAKWIPAEVRGRIRQNEQNRINKEGYLVLSSQEHRTQLMNKNQVVERLKDIILKHYARPKERTVRKTGDYSSKERRKKQEEKKRQSITKENRRKVDF